MRFLFAVWKYSGGAYIAAKATSSENKEHHPTLVLWILGLYFAVFGIASQRYENQLDRLENKTNILVAQTTSQDSRNAALSRIPFMQRIKIPLSPNIFNPYSVFCSMICAKEVHFDTVQELKNIVVSYKDNLEGVYLVGATLSRINLSNSMFKHAVLLGANFSKSHLNEANFYNAKLNSAELIKTNLRGAIFIKANLAGADLSGAKLSGANFNEAILDGANFSGTSLSKVNITKASFRGADLSGMNLSGTNLNKTLGDSSTILPDDTAYPDHWLTKSEIKERDHCNGIWRPYGFTLTVTDRCANKGIKE